MGSIKVILNPAAGRGYSAQMEGTVCQLLEEEGLDFDLVRTEGPWHAAELAERAAKDGCEVVVAAGGDGTANEIINGLMRAPQDDATAQIQPRLAIIPAGSGSDFATGIGLPADLREACSRVAGDQTKTIDIGRVTVAGQEPRYFGNVVGVGFDGAVLLETLKIKRLRGLSLYLLAVLRTVFLSFKAPMTTIEYDGQRMDLSAMMVTVTNGPREGGGFFIAPEARPDDGLFDVCIGRQVSRLTILRLIPHFLKGTHVDLDPITMLQAREVTISSPDGLIAHVDGEVLCTDAPWIKCEIIPGALTICG
ncbi:MAG: diacylglycerol kinase family lipid kinase [Anaerolineae bacterium]|jgi:YegS/Rv2252/BmrU family lipid kinase